MLPFNESERLNTHERRKRKGEKFHYTRSTNLRIEILRVHLQNMLIPVSQSATHPDFQFLESGRTSS